MFHKTIDFWFLSCYFNCFVFTAVNHFFFEKVESQYLSPELEVIGFEILIFFCCKLWHQASLVAV